MLVILFAGASFAQSGNILDAYEALTADEEESLLSQIENIRDQYAFEVVIVITDQLDGKNSRDYADDYYDASGYGMDDENSGILMLVNMDEGEVWLSTTGRAIEIFTDSRIDAMTDKIAAQLSEDAFYKSGVVFLEDVSLYLESGVPQGQVTVDGDDDYEIAPKNYFEKVMQLMLTPWVYLAALVISIGTTIGLSMNSSGKKTTHFQTYEEEGSFDLRRSEDTYLRETVSKTAIPKDSPKNTSTTHRGSSGTRHGGGGKKF